MTETSDVEVRVALQGSPDGLIQDLVDEVNAKDAEIPITLVISGIVVTGSLVSFKSYLDYMITGVTLACKDEQIINSMQSNYRAKLAKAHTSPESEKTASSRPSFIHMKDARFPDYGSIQRSDGIWRFSISKVDGFILGTKVQDRSVKTADWDLGKHLNE